MIRGLEPASAKVLVVGGRIVIVGGKAILST